MKVLKKILKGLFCVLILALLAAPLGLIFEISSREKQEYVTPTAPRFVETAYGGVFEAERMDMREAVLVSGVFRSDTYAYFELDQREPSKIRWNVGIGDEIQEGQVLGVYKGEDVISPIAGLISEMHAYSSDDAYIKVQMAAPVLLECDVSMKTLVSLRYAKALTTEYGEAVTLEYVANIRNEDGTTRVRFSIDSKSYYINQRVTDMKLYTGNEYLQALVLPECCLYQKVAGEDEPWYAREVTDSGTFVAEREVGRGYSDGEWVCVTGISAGGYYDGGYKQIVEGVGAA